MFPIDDASWPNCDQLCKEGQDSGWCQHIRNFLIANGDYADLTPGEHYCVPVFPDNMMFAQVSLDMEILNKEPMMCRLWLVRSDPADVFGISDVEMIPLGIHTAGEGRRYITSILHDWLQGQQKEVCHWTSHGLNEENKVQQWHMDDPSSLYWANQWCTRYKGKCLPCFYKEINDTSTVQNWSASSFGLDGVDNGPGRPNQQSTLGALQSRFGL